MRADAIAPVHLEIPGAFSLPHQANQGFLLLGTAVLKSLPGHPPNIFRVFTRTVLETASLFSYT